jgi:hypothetical protein
MNLDGPPTFQGSVKKIQIISNNICYGHCPEPDEEVEQRLTINADGRVWFSGYNFGQGFHNYLCGRRKNFTIGKKAAAPILNAIGTYFSTAHDTTFVTDIGRWDVTITNTEGKPYQYTGSICCDFIAVDVDLSDLIRDTLDLPDLFVFDGNSKPDSVNKISINYHRVTKIKPNVPLSDSVEYCTWDYSEQLILDRESESLEHIQQFGSGCIVSKKYYVQDGVVNLLDNLDVDSLFAHISGNSPDDFTDPLETKNYEITVDFKKRPRLMIKGTFDKNGLPGDFPELAESIIDFMQFYGIDEMLNPAVYTKARRKTNDSIFCSVEFNESGKSYYYATEDDTLKIGDDVLVPVGKDGHSAIAKIILIEYFQEDKAPFPMDKVKRIIRKCTDDDFNTPIKANCNEKKSIELDKINPMIEKRFDNKDPMVSFEEFELCNEEFSRVKVKVWAELSGGCLIISGQDLGEAAEVMSGEDEYEYFYNFDQENTELLFALLAPKRENIKEMLLQKFGGMDGCSLLREFCNVNNITYSFFSC